MPLPAPSTQHEIQLNDREQIAYLLGNPPSWMMRYGITVMLGVFGFVFLLSYIVHYPDTVEANVTLTTTNPPIRLLAQSSGRVQEILMKDKASVTRGQVLAVLENTAHWQDILQLEAWLEKPEGGLPEHLLLGELQNAYSELSQHWKDKDYFNAHNGVPERIAYLQQQIDALQLIKQNQFSQLGTLKEEFTLATRAFEREKQLHLDKLVSDKDFEISEGKFLGQKRQLVTAEATLLQQDMQIKQLESQINDLRQGKSDTNNQKELTLAEDIRRLQSAIASWKQSFLVIAPIDGSVSFAKIWSPQQAVNAGEEVLSVVPASAAGTQNLVGKVSLPVVNAGKIAVGQKAILRFDGFPAQQFGVVEARVANISLLPQKEGNETSYLLDLQLPENLHSTYQINIPFRQEMTGQVRIILEDRRVLERLLGKVADLLRNH